MTRTRKLALAGAALLAAGGAGAAYAANGQGNHLAQGPGAGGTFVSARMGMGAWGGGHMRMGMHGPADDLAAAATYLGLTTTELQTDLRSGKTLAQVADATSGKSSAGLVAALVAQEKQELAAAVTAGRLTQAQADALSANIQQRVTDLVNGTHPPFGGGMGFGHHGPGGLLSTAASYLGTTTSALVTQLQSGKTLAQVANATSGKSADGLVAALVAQEQQELAAAVTAGRLTQAQADALSATIQQRVTDMVDGVLPGPRMHDGWGGGMHGGWGAGTPGA